jgi:hypothetical protein
MDGGGDPFVDVCEGYLKLLFWLCHCLMIVESSERCALVLGQRISYNLEFRIIYHFDLQFYVEFRRLIINYVCPSFGPAHAF